MLGKADLDTLLSEREQLNESLQQIIDEQTEPWGVKVTTVEIKDVGIPAGHAARDGPPGRGRARAARQGHQRRGRVPGLRAAVRGGRGASSGNPAALQLRYLQTLLEIGTNQNSTIVLPVPIDLIKPLMQSFEDGNERRDARPRARPPACGPGRGPGCPDAEDGPSSPTPTTPATCRGERKTTSTG